MEKTHKPPKIGILDAISKNLFRGSDFGKLLVCCKVHENLTESIEKHFVALFGG